MHRLLAVDARRGCYTTVVGKEVWSSATGSVCVGEDADTVHRTGSHPAVVAAQHRHRESESEIWPWAGRRPVDLAITLHAATCLCSLF